jgi:hypothetical protein
LGETTARTQSPSNLPRPVPSSNSPNNHKLQQNGLSRYPAMNVRQNLFGQGPKAGREQSGYGRPPAPPPRDDTPMGGYDDPRGSYNDPRYGAPMPSSRSAMPSRPAVGRAPPASPARRLRLEIAKIEWDKTLANQYIFGNLYVRIVCRAHH